MQSRNKINEDTVLFRLKINSVSVLCLFCPPFQHCAALFKATLIVVVLLSLLLPPLLLLLPLLSSLLLLSLSHCPPRPLLPPPLITASTYSPQSSAATLPLSITAAIKCCLHCPPRPPSASSIAAVRCQSPLSPPSTAAVKHYLCRCHLSAAVKHHQTLLTRSNAPAHCHHPPLSPNALPLTSFIAASKCQLLL